MATNNAINKKSASITFDGTNLLSSYVNATSWTPDLQFGGAKVGITYGAQEGRYVRIGNVIFFSGRIALTSKGSSSGDAEIHGLPVTAAQYGYGQCIGYANVTFTGDSLYTQTQASTTYFIISICSNSSGAPATFNNTHMENDSDLRFSGFYFV